MVTILKESSVRNLTKTLAVVSLLVPASAYPLGIGEIKLHSALNQNLDAEISLVLSPGEKVSDIKVNLASPDKFDDTGVPWTYFLTKLKFEPVTSSNGSVVIKISSNEALKEPFLDLLLEVSWPKGSLYREFTVLLDPPGDYHEAAIPVSARSEIYKSEPNYTYQQKPARRTQGRVKRIAVGANEYGPTIRSDTLWNVAERLRDEDVSIEQVMIALYEENPRAFYQQNINALLAGKTLKIPPKEVILKFSKQQALDEFNRQTQAWKHRLTEAGIQTAHSKLDTADNQLTLDAPAQAVVSENAVVASGNEQVATEKAATKASPTAPESVSNQAQSQVSEIKDEKTVTGASASVNDALQSKVEALEKQMAAMQELIALKDQQLAALQNQAQQPKPVIQDKTAQTPPANVPSPKPIPVEQPVRKPTVAKPQIQPEAGGSDSWYYLALGGVGAGLLSYIAWIWWRKRQFEAQSDSGGVYAPVSYTAKTNVSDSYTRSAEQATNDFSIDSTSSDNLFVGDFASSDFDVFDVDQGEIDPISEADVYLAYGRYQQAEDLMRDAIKQQPNSDEYKLKLLEIFYANENKQAFETYARELIDAGKEDDIVFWAKVTEMGSEICPDSILFSSEKKKLELKYNTDLEKKKAEAVGTVSASTDLIDEMDFDLASFEELFYEESAKKTTEAKDALFDINSFGNKSSALEKNDDEVEKNNASIDFDIGTFTADNSKKINESTQDSGLSELKIKDEIESLEFDLSAFTASDHASDKNNNFEISKDLTKEEFESFDFSPKLDEAKESDDLGLSASESINEQITNDSFSDDFDFNLIGTAANDQAQGGFGISDLSQMDEMETKLDLAIAYIDMGDAVAAKEIALEVLEKGTEEQQMVAKALLESLK